MYETFNKLSLFSNSWYDDFPNNNGGNFTIPLEVPLFYNEAQIGVSLLTTTGSFFNVPREDYITLYASKDNIKFRYVATVVIPAGYYATGRELVDIINMKMSSLSSYVPTIIINPKIVVSRSGEMKLEGGITKFIEYNKNTDSFSAQIYTNLSCIFPEFVYRDLNFSFGARAYRWQRNYGGDVKLKIKGNFRYINLWCNLSDYPLLTLPNRETNILKPENIEYADYKLMGKSVEKVNFFFKNEKGLYINKGKSDETSITVVIKSKV